MTAKEKAKELIEKFKPHAHANWENYNLKQCALIAVDEIIDVLENALIQWHIIGTEDEILDYWKEVREEIENFSINDLL